MQHLDFILLQKIQPSVLCKFCLNVKQFVLPAIFLIKLIKINRDSWLYLKRICRMTLNFCAVVN